MAGGQEVEVFSYKFTARPKSRLRRIFRDFLPYWQSSKSYFEVTVTKIGNPPPMKPPRPDVELRVLWWIVFQGGHHTGHFIDIPPLEQGQSITLTVGGRLLGFTGDTLLVIPSQVPEAQKPDPYHTLYCFHSTPKIWIFLTALVGILSAGLATLGNWLISCD